MKTLLVVAALLLFPATALAQAPWFPYTESRWGDPLPDTNGVCLRFADGKIYWLDWAGNVYKAHVLLSINGQWVTLDSLIRAKYGQFGTGHGAPSFPLEVIGDALIHGNLYMWDTFSILNYASNAAGINFHTTYGTRIRNLKGYAMRVTTNAAENALVVDSAQITLIAPLWTLTSGSTIMQIMANSGAYGWMGTQSNDPLYIGVNNSGKILINTNGTLRFLAYGAGTLRSDASGNITATAADTVGLGAALWANRNNTYYTRANSDTWNSNAHQANSTALTTQALQDGRLRAWPFWVGKGYSIDSVRFEVSTGSSGNVAFAIYIDSDGDLYPDTRVFDLGAYTTTTTGVYGDTATVSLSAGGSSFTFSDNTMYWLGAHCKGGATLRAVNLSAMPSILGINPAMGSNNIGYTAWSLSSTYTYPNSCPNPFSASASKLATVMAPLLIWRVKP